MSVELEIRDDGIAVITLNRPEFGNAIDLEMARELKEAVLDCGRRSELRALILRGGGNAFCVGGDLKYIREAGEDRPATLRTLVDAVNASVRWIRTLSLPVIAAIEGPVAGVGISLVCLCDLAFASADSTFTVAYSAVGLSPDGGCSWLLPRVVGPRVAADLMLTNRTMQAAEAAEAGLINEAVATGEALARATETALRIARFPREAVAATRRLFIDAAEGELDPHLGMEAVTISRLSGEPESVQAVDAFLERRSAATR